MSRKTLGRCELLLLSTVALFTTLLYAEGEPLVSGATREVTVTATIPEHAEASIAGDIVVVMNEAEDLATGSTTVTVGANFAYLVSVHWLEGNVWNPGYYTIVTSDINGDYDPGAVVDSLVYVMGFPNIEHMAPGPVGTEAGAEAPDSASVYYEGAEPVGIVQVTISHQ